MKIQEAIKYCVKNNGFVLIKGAESLGALTFLNPNKESFCSVYKGSSLSESITLETIDGLEDYEFIPCDGEGNILEQYNTDGGL